MPNDKNNNPLSQKEYVSAEEFKLLEEVSKLTFDSNLRKKINKTIEAFTGYLEKAMCKLSTEFVDEIETPKQSLTTFREDKALCGNNVLTNTKTSYNYFVVPKVLSKE